MAHRLGNAIILLGLIALTVFAITFWSGQFYFEALLLGGALSLLGLALRSRARPQAGVARRGRLLGRMLGREEEEEA